MKVSLCKECGSCPEVALRENRVEIGESGNLVKLTKEQWNALVEKVKKGKLQKV